MSRRSLLWCAVALVALAMAPWIGPTLTGPRADFIFWQLRVPRVVLGALAGATLALSGAATQTLLRNPLASPSTLGTTAGASLAALVAVVFVDQSTMLALPVVALAAFAGALAVSLAVAAVAASGRARTEDILLVGVGLSLGAGALTTGVQVQADLNQTYQAVRWALGSVSAVGLRSAAVLLPWCLLCWGLILSQTRALASLAGGEARAASQGVDVRRTRLLTLLGVSVGVGAVVAWCGPIGFVGLVVPHVVRLGWTPQRQVLLPASALLGAVGLVLADAAARLAGDLPVGVLTSGLGAPVLIALILRGRRP